MGRGTFYAAYALVIVVLVLGAGIGLAAAQDGGEGNGEGSEPGELPPGVTQRQVDAVASRLIADEDGGLRLSECRVTRCDTWRQEIAEQLGKGRTVDEVVTYFVDREDDHFAQMGSSSLPLDITWNDVNGVARKMYCDVCEGVPLDECTSPDCDDWREKISYMLALDYSDGEIIDYFVENHGAEVASDPRDWTVFAIPTAIVLLVGIAGALQMRRLRQHGHHAGQPVRRRSSGGQQARAVPDDVDPYYLEQVERELGELDS